MKKTVLSMVALVFVAAFIVGCASPFPYGVLYTEIKAPVSATDGGLNYSKVGTASAQSILGMVATGDCSIKAAAANGGITKIKFVDYSAKNILGIIGDYTTTVYGD